MVNQESLSNQLNEQATFVFFFKKKEETKYFVLRIFSHTQIDCPPIIFLGFGNAKCHTVYIVKTKTFHLSLSIFPLFFLDTKIQTKSSSPSNYLTASRKKKDLFTNFLGKFEKKIIERYRHPRVLDFLVYI